MAPSPIPAPLPLWAKALLWFGDPIADYLWNQLDHEDSPGVLQWQRVQSVWTRTTPAATNEDKAIVTMDLVNITGGALDVSWSAGDKAAAETDLDVFWNAVCVGLTDNHTMSEYRWYDMAFREPAVTGKPFAPTGPPSRITTKAIAGDLSTGRNIYQHAMTVTEKTAWPKHWGRIYIPGVSSDKLGTAGHYTAAWCDTVANAYRQLMLDLNAQEHFLVVPVTRIDKVDVHSLITVSAVQVDDVPDVIRSRRPKQASYRKVLTA